MLVYKCHAATKARLIWVACSATKAMVTPKLGLLLRAMSRSVVLLQLGSVLISRAYVFTGVIGNKHIEI